MHVTDNTKRYLADRRFSKEMVRAGYEPIEENGHPLWKFARGGWWNWKIADARVNPSGSKVYIKPVKV